MLASFGLIAGNQNTVYSLFADGEKPNPKITLSNGEEVELDASTYTRVRTAENKDDRKKFLKLSLIVTVILKTLLELILLVRLKRLGVCKE